jgi:hypothetical protein
VDDADAVKERHATHAWRGGSACFSGGQDKNGEFNGSSNFDERGSFASLLSLRKEGLALAVGFGIPYPGDRICQHHAL